MRVRNAVLSVIGAALIGTLVYLDRFRSFYDVPLLALLLVGTLICLQEWTQMAARKDLHFPISAMNLSGALVCLFVYYFREPASSEPLPAPREGPSPLLSQTELALSLLLAILALVLTTTLITYVTTRRPNAKKEFLLGVGGTAYLAGGFSFALLLEFLPRHAEVLQDGGLTVIAVLAAVWLSEGISGLADQFLARPESGEGRGGEGTEENGRGGKGTEENGRGGKGTEENGKDRPAPRRSRRSRGKRRKTQEPATSGEPSPPGAPSFRQSPLFLGIAAFAGIVLGRKLLSLKVWEALLVGLAVGGLVLIRPFLRRMVRRTALGSPALSAPPRPARTLPGAVAAVVSAVLVFDLLGERYLGLNTTQAMLTGLALALAARASGRILYAVKRALEVRDTGSLWPGYGGLLDHLGSLFLALPAAYYCLRWLLCDS